MLIAAEMSIEKFVGSSLKFGQGSERELTWIGRKVGHMKALPASIPLATVLETWMPKLGSATKLPLESMPKSCPVAGDRERTRRDLGTHRSELHNVLARSRRRIELERRRRRAGRSEREVTAQRERGRIGRHQELAIVLRRQPERDIQAGYRRTGDLAHIQAGRETEAEVAVECRAVHDAIAESRDRRARVADREHAAERDGALKPRVALSMLKPSEVIVRSLDRSLEAGELRHARHGRANSHPERPRHHIHRDVIGGDVEQVADLDVHLVELDV